MFYNWKRELNASQMAVEMRDILGNVVTEQTCRNWIGKFEDEIFSFNDNPRTSRPSNENLNSKIEEYLHVSEHVSSRELVPN